MSPLGTGIRLESVVFRQDVRIPGQNSVSRFLPATDYLITYYPETGVVTAKLKDGVRADRGQPRIRGYAWAGVADVEFDMESLGTETLVQDKNGVLVMPAAPMVQRPDGSWERRIDAPEAPPKQAATAASTDKKRGGWPKGKPRASKPADTTPAANTAAAKLRTRPAAMPAITGTASEPLGDE